MAIPATCVCVIANKEAASVYMTYCVEVTAIETLSGNSDITACQVMQFRTLSVLSTSNGSRVKMEA